MSLKEELGLKENFVFTGHESLLNIYHTASKIKKRADGFFRPFGLTDVQYNVLILLKYHSGPEGGLSQAALSDMMLVNRANVTSLIDRMEKASLVVRTAAEGDRRYNIVKLTSKGKKLMEKVEPAYKNEVKKIMACLNEADQKKLVNFLERLRGNI